MLTSPQFALLRAALLDGYRTEQQLAIMVRIQLAKNLYEIAGGNTLGEVVFSLIEWAERTGHLAKLIVGAYEHNPDNDKLRHLFEAIKVPKPAPKIIKYSSGTHSCSMWPPSHKKPPTVQPKAIIHPAPMFISSKRQMPVG